MLNALPRSLLLLPLLMLLLCADSAHACQCAEAGPPCADFWKADAVFVATVVSKTPERENMSIHLASDHVFRGDLGGREVDVMTGFGDADCGYRFETGKKYLVYATRWEKDQKLYTGICSRTRLLTDAEEDLAYFRNLPAENTGGKILVKVTKLLVPIDDSEERFDISQMSGLRVVVERDNKRLEGTTNEQGAYDFTGLSPGKYNVRVYFSADPDDFMAEEVDVNDRGCASAEFLYQAGGNILGKIIDSNGKPVSGVKVDLIRLEDAASNSPKGRIRFSKSDGNYEIPDVPPGKYVLGINLIGTSNLHCPLERTYYVNPNSTLQAGFVEIKAREVLKDYDIQLPAGGAEREFEGLVVWPDGKPAVRAVVNMMTGSEPFYYVGQQKVVDARGRFVFKGIEGCSYRVNAFTYGGRIAADSNVEEAQSHAEPFTITLTSKKPPLVKLTLSSPGIEHRDDERTRPRPKN